MADSPAVLQVYKRVVLPYLKRKGYPNADSLNTVYEFNNALNAMPSSADKLAVQTALNAQLAPERMLDKISDGAKSAWGWMTGGQYVPPATIKAVLPKQQPNYTSPYPGPKRNMPNVSDPGPQVPNRAQTDMHIQQADKANKNSRIPLMTVEQVQQDPDASAAERVLLNILNRANTKAELDQLYETQWKSVPQYAIWLNNEHFKAALRQTIIDAYRGLRQ